MTDRTLIIAEAGVNHNGDIEMALKLVDRAAESGADVVKFQTFDAERLASATAPKAAYQDRTTGSGESQLDMLRRLELSEQGHQAVLERCKDRGIEFLSSPFDEVSLKLLIDRFGLEKIKLGSGELTNGPLLLAAARTGAELILSTGMGTLGEIEEALGVLAYGFTQDDAPRKRSDCAAILGEPDSWKVLRDKVTLLHCTTEYPAPVEEVNLRAMATMRSAFGLRVGYSDHTEGSVISLAAVALGAEIIEKHFTLDRSLPGPDHAASLEPSELAHLVSGIRAIETALGSGIKQPGPAELPNRSVARKSLHAARDLPAGKKLEPADLAVLRPGDGACPMQYWERKGTALGRDYVKHEQIDD